MLPVGDDTTPIQHYGHANDLSTYENKGHVFFVNFDVYPTEKLKMHLKGTYTLAQGEFDSIELELPHEVVHIGDYEGYNIIHNYSDIDQTIIEFDAGMNYAVSDHVGIFGDVYYADFDDAEPWVYRDQSGHYYDVAVGAMFSF